VVSVVRTESVGFLDDRRRVNVMLSRCKKAMVVIAKREFLENKAKDTLLGLLAQEFEDRWTRYEDLVSGQPLFNHDVSEPVD